MNMSTDNTQNCPTMEVIYLGYLEEVADFPIEVADVDLNKEPNLVAVDPPKSAAYNTEERSSTSTVVDCNPEQVGDESLSTLDDDTLAMLLLQRRMAYYAVFWIATALVVGFTIGYNTDAAEASTTMMLFGPSLSLSSPTSLNFSRLEEGQDPLSSTQMPIVWPCTVEEPYQEPQYYVDSIHVTDVSPSLTNHQQQRWTSSLASSSQNQPSSRQMMGRRWGAASTNSVNGEGQPAYKTCRSCYSNMQSQQHPSLLKLFLQGMLKRWNLYFLIMSQSIRM